MLILNACGTAACGDGGGTNSHDKDGDVTNAYIIMA